MNQERKARYVQRMTKWVTATLAGRHDWDTGLATLRLDAEPFDFSPGQFVNLALTLNGERIKRAYSLASAPGAAPEFYLAEVDGGSLSPHLLSLKPGQHLELDSNAQGFFTLDWLPSTVSELWLLATGTGLGPFVSLWRSGALFPKFQRVVVVHGVRTGFQLGYREELERLREVHPLSYVPLLTRAEPEAGMLGGRIPAAINDGGLEQAAGLRFDPERSHVMLCGNPDMIRDAQEALAKKGLRKHRQRSPGHVTTEKYW